MNKQEHPFLARTRTFINYEELYEDEITIDKIEGFIKSLPIEYWIRIASVGRIILDHYERDFKYQRLLYRHLGPDNLSKKEIRITDGKERAIFHRTQFLALLRLALLFGVEKTDKNIEEQKVKDVTIRCLTGINSLIYATTKHYSDFTTQQLMNKLTFNTHTELNPDEQSFMMNVVQVYYNHLTETISHVVGRDWEMLFDIPSDPNFQPQGVTKDLLHTTIQAELGISILEYCAMTFAIFAKYESPENIFKNGFDVTIRKNTYLEKSKLKKDIVNKYFDIVTQSRTSFCQHQKGYEKDLDRLIDFRQFMLKPLVHLDNSMSCFPTSLLFLHRLLDSGLTWVIGQGSFLDKLRNYWGQVFEFYCHRICKRIVEHALIKPKYFPEMEYSSSGKQKKSCDAIFIYDNSAVLLEFKTKAMKLEGTIFNSDYPSFVSDIEKSFITSKNRDKAATQIDETIKSIRSGDLVLPGIQAKDIKRYFPVVITMNQWPLGPFIYELIRKRIYNAKLLRQQHIAQIEIWSIEEFENIETLLSLEAIDLSEFIRRKLISQHNPIQLSTYIYDYYPNIDLSHQHLSDNRDKMFKMVLPTLDIQP